MLNTENENIVELRKELLIEARSQSAKWLIAGTAALLFMSISGWWLYLKPKIFELAGGVPSGTVAAFDTPGKCPDNWTAFNEASGRFIIGTGKSKGLTVRKYREDGGAETHTLTTQEMPAHTHSTIQMIMNNSIDGVDSATTNSYEHHNESRETGSIGSGSSHNNMPPFIALKVCKKT